MTSIPYRDLDAYHSTLLRQAQISLKHADVYMRNGFPETKSMAFGTCFDMRVFEPEKWRETYAVAELDLRTKEGKSWKAAQLEEGRTIITKDENKTIGDMFYALVEHPISNWLLFSEVEDPTDRMVQVEMIWNDHGFNVPCKGKLDLLVRPAHDLILRDGTVLEGGVWWLVDLKTTSDPNPRRFSQAMARYGYDLQLAFYADGCAHNDVRIDERVVIIAIGKSGLHDVVCHQLTEDKVLFHGREKYQQSIRLIEVAKRDNYWPAAYENELVRINLPEYAYSDDTELTMNGEEVQP